MAANHFLSHNFLLPDAKKSGVKHQVELFEHGGNLYLRLWISGVVGDDNEILCMLTPAQAEEFAQGAERLSTRIVRK